MFIRTLFITAAFIFSTPSFGEDWPSKPIRWIVPFNAGGPTDLISRFVAKEMSKSLGQPIVVENILGASGSIGLDKLARSKPDGYTIGTTANSLQAVAPHLIKLPYDAVNSFTPLGGLAEFPYALIVRADSPIRTFDDLIARAKASPGALSVASWGIGTGSDLAAVLLAQRAVVEFTHVRYATASLIPDLIGGHIDFTFEVIGTAIPMVKSGEVRALATTGPARHPLLNDTQTFAESVPNYEVVSWFAVAGPKGMDPEIIKKLDGELDKVRKSASYREFLNTRGYASLDMSPDVMRSRVSAELEMWGGVISRMRRD